MTDKQKNDTKNRKEYTKKNGKSNHIKNKVCNIQKRDKHKRGRKYRKGKCNIQTFYVTGI